MTIALRTTTIGFPRIGAKRQLKFALEKYWAGKTNNVDLSLVHAEVEKEALSCQSGIDVIGVDSTLYDQVTFTTTEIHDPHFGLSHNQFPTQVLDTIAWLGVIPSRFREDKSLAGLDLLFAMARGATAENGNSIAALDMR